MRSPRSSAVAVVWAVAAVTVLAPGEGARPAWGQFPQYTQPGGATEESLDPESAMEQALEDARWGLGPVRLAPWIGISQVAWVDDVFGGSGRGDGRGGGKVSDFTATVGAGLTAYLPTGPDVYWLAEATPQYVAWQDLAERRQVIGRYGAGVFAFFNRLTLRVRAGREEEQRVFSSEFPQPAIGRREHVAADAEVRLTGKISLYAHGERAEVSDQTEGADEEPDRAPFAALDRDERRYRYGLRYRPTERVRIGLGVERTELDSAAAVPRNLSNEGTAPVFELVADGNKLRLGLDLTRLELEPVGASRFAPYEELGGSFHGSLALGARTRFEVYGSSFPVLSLAPGYSAYEERRIGLGLGGDFGTRTQVRLFTDQGENRYRPIGPGVPERTDEVRAVGAELRFAVTRSLAIEIRAESLEIDSDLAGEDREMTRVSTGITLSTPRLLWR